MIRAYHGTVVQFDRFSKEKADVHADFGAGIYFSSDEYDIKSNYATKEGPDITNRIEQRAERIEQERDIP